MANTNLFPDETGFSPRPAWQVIEAARRQYLSGELTLPTKPATKIFLRDGTVYFAERSSDGTLPIRLMLEGVITREQMQRATVIVNGVEHVGRMFDKDPTIDRASVELCTELFTDDVMVDVANVPVNGYEMSLYRRHPSGIDRWYPQSLPVMARHSEPQPVAALPTDVPEPAAAPKVAAKPEPKPVVKVEPKPVVQAQAEPRNKLNGPPITQAVPVTVLVESAIPPPPPITQTVPVIPPVTAARPGRTMPAPTAQIPVTLPARSSAEADASEIADEVAEAIKRVFAGMGTGQ